MQCTLCIMQIAVCIRQCVVCNVLCAVFSTQCVQCVVCGVHAVLGAVFAVHFVVSIGLGWCGMGGGGQIGLATLRELNCFLHAHLLEQYGLKHDEDHKYKHKSK